jgi:hypothetical protein
MKMEHSQHVLANKYGLLGVLLYCKLDNAIMKGSDREITLWLAKSVYFFSLFKEVKMPCPPKKKNKKKKPR